MTHWFTRVAGLLVVATLALAAPPAAAQDLQPGTPEYDAWKLSLGSSADRAAAPPAASEARRAADPTGLLFPYPGDGGWTALPKNDDGSTGVINLSFAVDFYGTDRTSLFVNNNGNITFGNSFSGFTASGFPIDTPMIAPFWADVDTRCTDCGQVYYKETTFEGEPVFVAHWDQVGFFSQNDSRLNTYQVVVAATPSLPGGNNVCFGYGDMQWTTGGASGGSGGLGGSPATVGANAGDGATFFQFGRFNKEGTDYDGPEGDPDGVDRLDGEQICFNTDEAANLPPVVSSRPDGPVVVGPGDPIDFSVSFIAPESEQTVTIASIGYSLGTFPAVMCETTVGGPGAITTVDCSGSLLVPGDYTVAITASDDGDPSASTVATVTIQVEGPVVCTTESPLSFDFDGDGDGAPTSGQGTVANDDFDALGGGILGEFAAVRNESDAIAADLTGCSFIVFDAVAEQVTYVDDLTTGSPVVAAGDTLVFANANGDRMLPAMTLPDGPGAFALVQGPAAVGDGPEVFAPAEDSDVSRVVAAVVYGRDRSVFGSVRGGLAPEIASAERAAFAEALAAAFGGATSDEGGPDGLAVRAWPNPAAGRATVSFGLADAGDVRAEVYDALGRRVAVVADGPYGVGRHDVAFDASALAPGAYVVRVSGAATGAVRLTVAR